ncbi:hypothetical protein ABEB36_009361 [Hypothenemus hampei]|uniref:Uncharacterized protein n=1 Tax=Hypothenemus hampei TaxID=57062 RepID=A0ABD1EG86_HYPHA
MVRLSETQRIENLIMIGYGDRTRTQEEVCELFNNKYPDRPITRSTISPPTIPEEKKLDILLTVEENPFLLNRQIAMQQEISQSSVLKSLKQNKWHPYKVHLVQEVNEDDFDRRIEFCETMMERCHNDLQFSSRALNGANYLELLQQNIIPAIAEVFPNAEHPVMPDNVLWFQQDGAPPHYSQLVRNYLDTIFQNKWIGYVNRPNNIEDLKIRITEEIRLITPQMLTNVTKKFANRLAHCQQVNGGQFEHLL